jgi:signal transduction histidine kinase
MMHEFLSANRKELIDRCRAKVAQRAAPEATKDELEHGIAHFLDQLIATLEVEQTAEPMRSRRISGPSGGGGGKPGSSEIGDAAAKHGRELLQHGFTVDQVVHDYGDLCQAITDLAFERNAPFDTDEFRTLNRCLDNAIADAVTEFSFQRDFITAGKNADALNERLGSFAHELRNLLNSATLALTAIREGNVGLNGATGSVLDRSLVGLRELIDRSLSDVRMRAGMPAQRRLFSLSDFIAEVKLSASLEAKVEKCVLTVPDVDSRLAVDGDRDLLSSAVGNLLQNAFKFTCRRSEVTLNAYAAADRILIEVQDHCGGLPAGAAEKMFRPFAQAGHDKTGVGLGLTIARRSVEVNAGTLSVSNIPGSGCVFTINLPRHSMPEPFSVVPGVAA